MEARASSEIENIVTTDDKLFRHLQSDVRADPATREALRYRRALLEGVRELQTRPLATRMAAAHYQFEAIHPFGDGNGRAGRVLNSLFLVEQGLLPLPILYLSRYIIAHRADAGRQAASRYLKALADIGVLREQAFGREKLFIHPKLMTLLTRDGNAFEAYRGRTVK